MSDHITVLKREAVGALNIKHGDTVVDATLGSLGHAREILAKLEGKGTFIGIDQDQNAIKGAEVLRSEASDTTLYLKNGNFRHIDQILDELAIDKVDGILADLGWRIEQFESSGRGFSFRSDEPLHMTYGDQSNYPFTAADIVNSWDENDIKNVLKGYGEERFSGRIAHAIVEARADHSIASTKELAEIISNSVPGFYRTGKVHPATKTFQALRITVNDELEALEEFITKSVLRLKQNGRLAIITFHSLEDRIVKHSFRALKEDGAGLVITKKPIIPDREEIAQNPRARSAKLRVFEKI